MEQNLLDKVAIVTGAGQGIGKGVALRLANAGAQVIIAEYNSETAEATSAEILALGRRSLAYQIDLSKVEQIQPMVDRVVSEFGRIDILVNNAGRVQTKFMLDLTPEDWDRVVDTNQRGTFFCLQMVAKQM